MNAGKFCEDCTRRIAQACAGLPLLKRLPQRVGEKADQDVRLDAILFVMPDRPDTQVGFLDAESSLGFAELDVGFPQRLLGPVVDIAAQNVGAFAEPCPILPLPPFAPVKFYPSRYRFILADRDVIAPRGA